MLRKDGQRMQINMEVTKEWSPQNDKINMEMVANLTPPTCIQTNIFSMACVMNPSFDVVQELPFLKYIDGIRSVLLCTVKTLSAFQLGHTDETACHQISLINVIIFILNNDGNLKSICFSGFIIAKDGTAEEQSQAIVASFKESHDL